ncbi:hypothetical protein [Pontimicrobium sp. MEBiC01747]
MSKELPSNKNTSEEVDLVVFFNIIGNLFTRLFNFIGSILKSIFSVIIIIIKSVVINWKIIASVIIATAILGYVLERNKPKVYSSDMLVRPYFDSKYQLVTNINYFNALIANQDYNTLKAIFVKNDTVKIDIDKVKSFKIEPGPETENDKVLQYQGFLRALDSSSVENVSFEDYIDNRSIYSGSLFLITVESYKKDIFKDLEYGINSAFTNDFSERKKKKENKLYELEKKNILENLKEVDSLQRIYIDVLQEETKNPSKDFKLGGFSLQQEKSGTKEYELLEKEIKLREQLRELEEKAISKDVFVDVISSFQRVGNQKITFKERYSIIFPLLAFVMLCLIYIIIRIIKYAMQYEN